MPSQFAPNRLTTNIIALAVLIIGTAYAVDAVGGWMGYRPGWVCGATSAFNGLSQTAALILGTTGALMLMVSRGKSSGGLWLMGAAVLAALAARELLPSLATACS
jgi:hypothetical protein